mgnify:CR=1 FL=1
MSDTTIPANTRVRYTDGHTDEIMVTMFQRTAAETYGKAHGWGSLMEAADNLNAHRAHLPCPQPPLTDLPFDRWLATVVSIEDINNDADTAVDMFGTPVAASVDDGEEEPDFGPFPAGTRTA